MENLKLRKYQLELAENALKGDNTIICAETGTGKTWVALHIVKKHLERLQNGKLLTIFVHVYAIKYCVFQLIRQCKSR